MKTYQVEQLLSEHKDLLKKYSTKKAVRKFRRQVMVRRIALGIILLFLSFALMNLLCDLAWVAWQGSVHFSPNS